MSSNFIRTRPSFLEAGLPCASLSAECQRDNNARQRPPQNRLHIWWARRPPTICRAAILAALLPYDVTFEKDILPACIEEPTEQDLLNLSAKQLCLQSFFESLINEIPPTSLPESHEGFLCSLGITGDPYRAYRRLVHAENADDGRTVILGNIWGFRHPSAFSVTPNEGLVKLLQCKVAGLLQLPDDQPIRVLDFMAGGGAIPLEGVRYGFELFANDLNPIASLVLKATIEYPARYGTKLSESIISYANLAHSRVVKRLTDLFPFQKPLEYWPEVELDALKKFKGKSIIKREPEFCQDPIKNTYLWLRQVQCSKCELNIPISTNFHVVNKKGKPEGALAAFPEVPPMGQGNECTFRIVKKSDWQDCHWPRPGFDGWHPRNTPTFKGGDAICPRCGNVVDGTEVKQIARSRAGGLPAQMYAVCSQVPVKLTYANGAEKIRYLWRFRAPTSADLSAAKAAEEELQRLLPVWEAAGLVPNEEIPEGDKTKEPRNMGIYYWRDLFLPRQLLTNLTVLEEIRKAQARAGAELPPDEAEAVSVYLAFILSKIVNYNSVNTFWHYGRQTVAQTFSRHDFAFRPAFCEFEGARETVMWGASQVIGAYEALAGLIHGQPVDFAGDDEGELDLDEVTQPDIEAEDAEDITPSSAESAENDTTGSIEAYHHRPEVIVPTVTCEDAAALSVPEPGSVHLICVDPPYYNNVQYSELSNFFYVWLKRSLQDFPGLAHLFREPLAESNREAVANAARWAREAEADKTVWQQRYEETYDKLRAEKVKVKEAKERAVEAAGPKPLSGRERADRFYEDKMAAIFRRARQLLHPAGRMVVMFNHKQTWAWRALGMALIRAGFEVRSSVPIHTEAESSLNIRGLDAARSTILLLCVPREEREQVIGNWTSVQTGVSEVAENAALRFYEQGIDGTDLYLSALGPAIGEVARNWPVTDFAGREIDLAEVLEQAYRSVGHWRLGELLQEMSEEARGLSERCAEFSVETMDRDSQALWLWLDTFNGDKADSDEVRKLAKSLNVDPADLQRMGLVGAEKEIFVLKPPQETDFRMLSLRLNGESVGRGRAGRAADQWEGRTFPNFIGAAVLNAIGIMAADGAAGPAGPEALRRWLIESGYGQQRDFTGAFAVTLYLLERVFGNNSKGKFWQDTARHARRAWDLVISNWQS
jgi:putative DNA methylase